ncbi:hypothetical protein F4777DRAFT_589701 [Nemania sp. FL0916]|nr:hypothetical protein F4777DRAFT_589701 [Nemania sp. FL0916]
MAAFLDAVGLISGFLGILQFGIDNFAEPESVGSTVRIAVGLDSADGKGGTNLGGDLPDVRLWNEAGEFLGLKVDPGKVEDGGFHDITIKHNSDSTQQATYTLFSANNDAICVAYATITWPNGDKYAWSGNWGHQCGGSWYYSNVYVGESNEKPDCLWIDGDNNQPQTGFQVHWPEFANKSDAVPGDTQGKEDKFDYLCKAGPPFKMYHYPEEKDPRSITYWIPKNSRSVSNRRTLATGSSYGPSKYPAVPRFQPGTHHRRSNQTTIPTSPGTSLVIGNTERHSVEGLCQSATSFGPDFMNTQSGTFCRMSDKTIWPVCNAAGNATDNCFNSVLNQLILNGVAARDEPYRKVIDWTST